MLVDYSLEEGFKRASNVMKHTFKDGILTVIGADGSQAIAPNVRTVECTFDGQPKGAIILSQAFPDINQLRKELGEKGQEAVKTSQQAREQVQGSAEAQGSQNAQQGAGQQQVVNAGQK